MAATAYEIQFKNKSKTAYHFGVYQGYPDSPGLKSVVWQVRGLGPGAINKVDWKLQYGVAITNWDENEQSYSGQQIVDAKLGSAYQVNTQQGDIPVIDPAPDPSMSGKVTPDQIKLHNNTSQKLDLGFAVDGKLIAVAETTGNQWANYIVHPIYYVALYRDIKLGSLVDSGIEVGPVKIEFEDGHTKAMVECISVGGRDELKASIIG